MWNVMSHLPLDDSIYIFRTHKVRQIELQPDGMNCGWDGWSEIFWNSLDAGYHWQCQTKPSGNFWLDHWSVVPLMYRVVCRDVLLLQHLRSIRHQCPTLCFSRWSCRWSCHVLTTATQHLLGFPRLSSVDFSRCSTPPPDWFIDLLGMSTSHRCCETFTGCGLRNASTSSWLCSSTDACTVWRHGIFPTTSSLSLIPTASVSGCRHPCS